MHAFPRRFHDLGRRCGSQSTPPVCVALEPYLAMSQPFSTRMSDTLGASAPPRPSAAFPWASSTFQISRLSMLRCGEFSVIPKLIMSPLLCPNATLEALAHFKGRQEQGGRQKSDFHLLKK